ncbi:MAG TPA: Hsp20/alpha crystallin family protein [Gemmataceae bacterium]|nr:Hsp20/alpha crystallin family protein [Gemmataceae bacterium]
MNPTVSLPALLSRLGRLPGELEELMEGLANKPRDWWVKSFPYPLVNVREEPDAFYVEAEVPGVNQDQIDVLIRHGTELTLQGDRKPVCSEISTWHYRERGEGRFHRVLTLPVPVDAGKVEARLEQGVLRLVLPKTEAVKPHRIPVQGANGET